MVEETIVVVTVGPRSDSNLVLETPVMRSGEGGQPVPKGLHVRNASVGISGIATGLDSK